HRLSLHDALPMLAKKLKALSLPDQKPAVDQTMSTDPWETASKDCSTGTSAFGSLCLIRMVPPEARSIRLVTSRPASPASGCVLPKPAAIWNLTVLSCAAAGAAASARTAEPMHAAAKANGVRFP